MSQRTSRKPRMASLEKQSGKRKKNGNEYANEPSVLRLKIQTDARFFLEHCTKIKDLHAPYMVPFVFNTAQGHYYDNVWLPDVRRDIVGKSRKWGFSTLRLGLGLHDAMFSEGRIFRVVAHKTKTAHELKETVQQLYNSALDYFEEIGQDPHYYLPRLSVDRVDKYHFKDVHSSIVVETASGRGVGQSDRSDDLYLTEYADWEHAEDAYAGLAGSLPIAGSNRITIDFNAQGMGNDAYKKYQDAKKGVSNYRACFYGILDCPEIYPPAKVESLRAEFRDKFPAVYPSNDEEMWLENKRAVFSRDDILACAGDKYFCDMVPASKLGRYEYTHGVDTATGKEDGDFQCMKGFEIESGIEAYPPLHERIPEDMFARAVWERWCQFPGILVVERNGAGAVIIELKRLGVPPGCILYRHRKMDKTGKQKAEIGFYTDYNSKRNMIKDFQRVLREKQVTLVSEDGRQELMIFEWGEKSDDSDSSKTLASAPEGFHDDEAMAAMLAIQGVKMPTTRGAVTRN